MVQNKDDPAVKRRGRPRAYDPVEALRKARDVFWRRGYSGTSLDDISAATGMNRPSLSAAFGDKHALYLAALRGYWETKAALMREALEGGTLAEALIRAYDASLSLYFSEGNDARGCFVVGTAITEAVEDAQIREIIHSGTAMLDAAFLQRFQLAADAGELPDDVDLETLAALATATMHTLAIRARAGAPCDELRLLAQEAVRMICRQRVA
jgi:AcrR family transcriptional regulator